MDPVQIAELLQPFLGTRTTDDGRPAIDDALYQDISTYVDILLRWTSRINLTAIRKPEEIVTRHFGESLFAARHLFPRDAATSSVSTVSAVKGFDPPDTQIRVADVGSGAGFPGIPIKLWAPDISLTLIESNYKKVVFLREVVRTLTLTNVEIQNVRAENIPPDTYDVVTLRAVERFREALPVAGKLMNSSGRIALLITASQRDVAESALQDFSWDSPLPIPGSQSRLLLVGRRRA